MGTKVKTNGSAGNSFEPHRAKQSLIAVAARCAGTGLGLILTLFHCYAAALSAQAEPGRVPSNAVQGKAAPARKPQHAVGIPPNLLTQRQQAPTLRLTVTPGAVRVGEEVVVGLDPAQVSSNRAFEFQLDFGDGSPPLVKRPDMPTVAHRYLKAGTFTISMSVRYARRLDVAPIVGPFTANVRVERWNLTAVPSPAKTGEMIRFAVVTPSNDSSIRYHFVFGDGRPQDVWSNDSEAAYSYSIAGTYQAGVEIGRYVDGRVLALAASDPIPVTVILPPVGPVSLRTSPPEVRAGEPVSFAAELDDRDPGLRFRFSFGDGSRTSNWSETRFVTHQYSTAGTYEAVVEIGRMNDRLTIDPLAARDSARVIVTQPSPQPPSGPSGTTPGSARNDDYLDIVIPAVLIAAAFLAVILGNRAWRGRVSLRPRLVLHPDAGSARIENGGVSPIEFEIRLNKALGEARHRTSTTGANIVEVERREA